MLDIASLLAIILVYFLTSYPTYTPIYLYYEPFLRQLLEVFTLEVIRVFIGGLAEITKVISIIYHSFEIRRVIIKDPYRVDLGRSEPKKIQIVKSSDVAVEIGSPSTEQLLKY